MITSVDKATGRESVRHGRFVDVRTRVAGKWLYLVDHPSSEPPAPARSSLAGLDGIVVCFALGAVFLQRHCSDAAPGRAMLGVGDYGQVN